MLIPATATFEALHFAIEAAFGWKGQNYDPENHIFKVIEENTLTENVLLQISGYDSEEHDNNSIGYAQYVYLYQVWDNFEFHGQAMQYVSDGALRGPIHAAQILGHNTSIMNEEAVCLGGQGHNFLRLWLAAQESKNPVLSTWALDLNKVNERMAEL